MMENNSLKNNELITGISIISVLRFVQQMEISKCMLIEPFLSYTKVLQLLARTNCSIKSVEDIIIKESISFSNFNERYKDNMILSINSILLFKHLRLLDIKENMLVFTGEGFDFNEKTLGNKTSKRISASENLAKILLKGVASDLYLCLRIEI